MTRDGSRPARAEVLVALVCASVVVAIWLLLPLWAAAEPDARDGLPKVGSLAWWLSLIVALAQSAMLAWRLRRPGVVSVVAAAMVPVGAATGMGSAIGLTSIAVLVAVYSLATTRPWAAIWSKLSVISALLGGGHILAGLRTDVPVWEAVLNAVVQAVTLVGLPVAVAAFVVTRRESQTAREDRVQALEREHDALVQAAVAGERTAMARELHDIAAHHLTGIAVMSAAIAGQIDTDPAGAKAAVGDVRQQITAVLRDLRSLVGLLRFHDATTTDEDARVESLAGVSDLVSEVAAAGRAVALTTLVAADRSGLGSGIGPLAQLAAYRTVQESLANAGRHASGARCEVEIDDRDPEALVVTVRNAAPTGPFEPGVREGFGLVGMKERAELTGSHLEVGPTPLGGWQVRLRTPRADPEETT